MNAATGEPLLAEALITLWLSSLPNGPCYVLATPRNSYAVFTGIASPFGKTCILDFSKKNMKTN